MKIEVKNLAGEKVTDLNLGDIFSQQISEDLVHRVYVIQYANRRRATAHTKTRGEVKGSTKKPWKQKGTGRARTGDVKNPLWRSGGTVFGPSKERNYKRKVNKKEVRLATLMALAGKLKDGLVVVVDEYKFAEPKTKLAQAALEKLGLLNKKVLMVFDSGSQEYQRISRNLPKVKNVMADNLNVLELLNNKYVLLTRDILQNLEKKFKSYVGKKSTKTVKGNENSQ